MSDFESNSENNQVKIANHLQPEGNYQRQLPGLSDESSKRHHAGKMLIVVCARQQTILRNYILLQKK
jgi:hypothetical protein